MARPKCIWDGAAKCFHPLVGENRTAGICLNCPLSEGFSDLSYETKHFFEFQWPILLELLIVVATIVASIGFVAPCIAEFREGVNVAAANQEASVVKMAEISYLADKGRFPEDSSRLISYLSGSLQADYTINVNTGNIVSASLVNGSKWEGAKWDASSLRWVK